MAYPAAAIANEFLRLAKRRGSYLTQMQVQKLVYFAHGWNLAITGEPLVNERVLAWEYGPVVKSLWRAFKEFGSQPITKDARVPDWEGDIVDWVTPRIDDGDDPEQNDFTKSLVRRIWNQYGDLKAFQLSELTHLEGSPWSKTRQSGGGGFIEDSDIRHYFQEQMSEEPVGV